MRGAARWSRIRASCARGEERRHDRPAHPRGDAAHPLDPLTEEEIAAAAAVLRRDQGVGERWRFASIELREPAKAVVRAFAPGDPIRRAAEVICWNRDDGRAYKALVSLTEDRVTAWEHRPGSSPT